MIARPHHRPRVVLLDRVELRQVAPRDLSAGGDRKSRQRDEGSRNHEIGQVFCEIRGELPGLDLRPVAGHVKGDEDRAGAAFTGDNRRLFHNRMLFENHLNLGWLDAVAPNLHLIVSAAEKIDCSTGLVAGAIPTSVETLLPTVDLRHNKALGRQLGTTPVTICQATASYPQIRDRANRRQLHLSVEEVDSLVGNGCPNRWQFGPGNGRTREPVCGYDMRFGRPIVVVERTSAQVFEEVSNRRRDAKLFAGSLHSRSEVG